MAIIIGSAKADERGKITGGSVGDQKQISSTNDTKGEVSMQDFYIHRKGWYILRPKNDDVANKIADAMKTACNNKNIGYDQSNRLGVLQYGVNTKTKTECDCSGLIRACIKEASGKDVGNFNTANEASVLESSGLFEKRESYKSGTTLYVGDVLVTKLKGHTVAVVEGTPRGKNEKSISTKPSKTYSYKDFVKEIQTTIGAKVDGIAGTETYSKCPTVSKSKNNRHAVVKPLQKYLNALGYNCGIPDGITGTKFDTAVKAWARDNGCVADGELTKNGKAWKKILGIK